MGYRSVRVLLQRPTGQRITRNSRLDSAEFERAPADLASLHRFALLCAQLASLRLSSLLSSLSFSLGSLESLSLLVSTGIPRSPPSLPTSTRSFQPGYPTDSRGRIENLLCTDRQPIATTKRGGIDDRACESAEKSCSVVLEIWYLIL